MEEAINRAETDLYTHALYDISTKYNKIITSANVCVAAAKACIEVPHPANPFSEHYISYAVNCQTYFITSVGIREALSLKHMPTFKLTEEEDAILTTAKAMRNVVAHGHLWLPLSRRENRAGMNSIVEYYGIATEKLKESVKLAFTCHKDKNPDKYVKKINLALNYIDTLDYQGYINITHLISVHESVFVEALIDGLDKVAGKEEFLEVSVLRKKCGLQTFEEMLCFVKIHHRQLISLQNL